MRVTECNECGDTVSGANDEELVAHLTQHLRSEHDLEPEEDEVSVTADAEGPAPLSRRRGAAVVRDPAQGFGQPASNP